MTAWLAFVAVLVAGVALFTRSAGAFEVAVILVAAAVLCGGMFGRSHPKGRRR